MTPSGPIGTFVPADGRFAHVRRDGDPDHAAVLLVHGFGGSMRWFDRVAALLAVHHHVVRVDLSGHGYTGGNKGLGSAAQAQLVGAVLERLDISGVTAVGHSFGADVALGLSATSPRVSRAMILGQAPDLETVHLPPGNPIMAVPLLGHVLHRTSPGFALRIGARWGFRPGFDQRTGFDDPDQVVSDLRAMHPRMYQVVLQERRRALAADPLDEQAARTTAPTTVVLGRHDQFYDVAPTAARYASAGLPVTVLENSGHSPSVEQPSALATLIREFASS